MTIPLRPEDPEIWDNMGIYESCHFCKRNPCKTWHENTNNPVCEACAKTHKVAELPDHGKIIRAKKRKMALNAKRAKK